MSPPACRPRNAPDAPGVVCGRSPRSGARRGRVLGYERGTRRGDINQARRVFLAAGLVRGGTWSHILEEFRFKKKEKASSAENLLVSELPEQTQSVARAAAIRSRKRTSCKGRAVHHIYKAKA